MLLCLGVGPDVLYSEHCGRFMNKCEIVSLKKKKLSLPVRTNHEHPSELSLGLQDPRSLCK